jgi:hypothetical protein
MHMSNPMRHIAAFLLGLVLCAPAHAAISVVWGDGYDGFDSAGNTTDDAVDTTGKTHAVAFACSDETTGVITFTDADSSTGWTYLTQTTQGDVTCRMGYVALASPGAGYTVTANFSASDTYRNVGYWLLDADNGTIVLDASAVTSAASGATVDAGTLSTTGASVVSVMMVGLDGASTGNTEGTGWTENSDQSENFGIRQMAQMRGAETTTPIDPVYTLANAAAPWVTFAASFREGAGGGGAVDQEGFRWGVDDGSESAHTFAEPEDTNLSLADTTSRLLRVLVEGESTDPASVAYTLRSQKNGSGGYVAVPVGSTTAGAGISNQTTAASADDSQDIAGTNTINGTTIGSDLDVSTDWAGMRFTALAIPAGATITAAQIEVVPSSSSLDEPSVLVFFEAADDCAAFTTGASNITGRSRTSSVSWASTDLGADGATYFASPSLVTPLQAVIDRAGWASGNDVCVLIQGGQGAATRDLTIEAYDLGPGTNPPRLDVSWTTPNQVYVTTSANIADTGEATTARLTAPSGKTTGDFVTGRRWDAENGTDPLDITTDDYTEVEWLVFIAASAAAADYFDFRVYAGGSALDTYSLTPRWTIPSTSVPQQGLHSIRRGFGPRPSARLGGLLH